MQRIPIGEFVNMTDATVQHMQRIIADARGSMAVHRVAVSIVSNTPPRDTAQQLHALHGFMRSVVRFKRDTYGTETLRHPDQLLAEIREIGQTACDCDDATMLACSIVQSLGMHPYIVLCRKVKAGPFVHVHAAAETVTGNPRSIVPIDPQEQVRPGTWTCPPELRVLIPCNP